MRFNALSGVSNIVPPEFFVSSGRTIQALLSLVKT
jgi:hypothetical protein